MPRLKRSKLSLTQESIEKHMNEVYSILESYKQMGVRHYNFVLRIIEELGSDSVEDPVRLQLMAQLEQSRNNSLNAFKEYLRMLNTFYGTSSAIIGNVIYPHGIVTNFYFLHILNISSVNIEIFRRL